MEMFSSSIATLTGGSGAAAVLLTDGSFDNATAHRLIGEAPGQLRSIIAYADGGSPLRLLNWVN